MNYNSIIKIKDNFSVDNVVRIFSILFVCLIEFRIFHQKSLSLADPIFVFLFTSIIARGRINFFSLLKYNANLVLSPIF